MSGQPRDRRRPRWVYSAGDEPDYRVTFANERTLLAWMRTALALVAAGVVLNTITAVQRNAALHACATCVLILGCVAAPVAWLHWARSERAIRLKAPLPPVPIVSLLVVTAVAWSLALALANVSDLARRG